MESQAMESIDSVAHGPLSPRNRLTDRVTEMIKGRILSGMLRPGDRVVEQKVARDFGVGQNAVREALIELAHMGFVRRLPRRGTYVTHLTQAEADKITEVRDALEGLTMSLLSARLKKETIDFGRAEEMVHLMRKAAKEGDILTFYDFDIRFHRALWTLTGNEYLAQTLEQLVAPLFAFFAMLCSHPKVRTQLFLEAVTRHEAILAALKSGSSRKLGDEKLRLRRISKVIQGAIISGDEGKADNS